MTNTIKNDFRSLLACQFFGALNDNIFKIVFSLYAVHSLSKPDDEIYNLIIINTCFVLPFILFSASAGSIADRYVKTNIVKFLKAVEVLIMILAALAFYFEQVTALFALLFLLGAHSAFFSPAKYGILPEFFSAKELSKANGQVEFWTFLAIILGTILGGLITHFMKSFAPLPGVALLLFAVLGLFTSLKIKTKNRSNQDQQISNNPLKTFRTILAIRKQKGLFLTLCGITYFWTVGLVYQLNLIIYAKHIGNLNEIYSSTYLLALGFGIGVGSVIAGKISESRVELGLVPLGSFGLMLGGLILTFSGTMYWLTCFALLLSGLSAGIFIVPLLSYFQDRSPAAERGAYLSALNFCSFLGMLMSGFALYFVSEILHFKSNQVFFVCAAFTVLVTIYLIKILPEMLMRCLNWVLIHSIYRLKIVNAESIPSKGGALLVCNHVSFIDAQLILAAIDRPVRYLIYKPIYELPIINTLAKAMGAIPIQGGSSKEEIALALQNASKSIQAGEIVCIFAEGGITRTGELNPFKKGLEIIMKDIQEPIIPVAIKQLWGSIFSYSNGKFIFKKPKKIPYPVEIEFGEKLESSTSADNVREHVAKMLNP